MFEVDALDIDDIAMALADQTDYDHRWLIDPKNGQLVIWTCDTGVDGEHPVDIEDLDLISIDPIPSFVWFHDMVDFANGISDTTTGEQLARTPHGRGAFRRFTIQIYKHPKLISPWQTLRNTRAHRRAAEWLLNQKLITDEAAQDYADSHPDPDLP